MEINDKRGGNQFQQMDGKGEGLPWSHYMGLHVCSELMQLLLEHTTLHEQRSMHNVIMLMAVG
jgi:hypothetical protein